MYDSRGKSKFEFKGPGSLPRVDLPQVVQDFAAEVQGREREILSSFARFLNSRSQAMQNEEWASLVSLAQGASQPSKVIGAVSDLQEAKRSDLNAEEISVLANLVAVSSFQATELVLHLVGGIRNSDSKQEFIRDRAKILGEICQHSGGSSNTKSVGVENLAAIERRVGRNLTISELEGLREIAVVAHYSFKDLIESFQALCEKGSVISAEGLGALANALAGMSPDGCRIAAQALDAVQKERKDPLSPEEQAEIVSITKRLNPSRESGALIVTAFEVYEKLASKGALSFSSSSLTERTERIEALHRISTWLEVEDDTDVLVDFVTNFMAITGEKLEAEPLSQLVSACKGVDGALFARTVERISKKIEQHSSAKMSVAELAEYGTPLTELSGLMDELDLHDWQFINPVLGNLEKMQSAGSAVLKPGDFSRLISIYAKTLRGVLKEERESPYPDSDPDAIFNYADYITVDIHRIDGGEGASLSADQWEFLEELAERYKHNAMFIYRGIGYLRNISDQRDIVETGRECAEALLEISQAGQSVWDDVLVAAASVCPMLEGKPITAQQIGMVKDIIATQNIYQQREELALFSTRLITDGGVTNYSDWIDGMLGGLSAATDLDCLLREITITRS